MPRGGRRPGAGRKPGVPTSRTTERMKYLGPVGERAIAVLVDAMQNPAAPWSVRVQAAGMVADRAYGRAPTSVSFEVARRLNDLTLDELRQLEAKRASEQQLTIDAVATPAADEHVAGLVRTRRAVAGVGNGRIIIRKGLSRPFIFLRRGAEMVCR
jgi:hypothetical protein